MGKSLALLEEFALEGRVSVETLGRMERVATLKQQSSGMSGYALARMFGLKEPHPNGISPRISDTFCLVG